MNHERRCADCCRFRSNVDHVRARGAELGFVTNDVLVRGLALSGNVTFVEPKTLAMSGLASATAAPDAAIGKQLPNIPKWRSTATAMYRPNDRLTYTLAARYSSKLYTTLDNVDVRYNTYQGFSEWFVMDTKVNFRVNENWSASGGRDAPTPLQTDPTAAACRVLVNGSASGKSSKIAQRSRVASSPVAESTASPLDVFRIVGALQSDLSTSAV